MTAKITLELDDKASPGLKQAAASARTSGSSFEELEGQLKGLEAELESVNSELEEMHAASKRAADGHKSLAASGANVAEKITAVSTATLAVVEVMKKGLEAGKKFVEVVNTLAEQGNPAAIELQGAFADVKKALFEMAQDPGVQDLLSGMATILKDDVVPLVLSLPEYWRDIQRAIARSIAEVTDFLNITEGAAEELERMNAQEDQRLEAAKKQTAAAVEQEKSRKAVADIETELGKIAEKKRQIAEAETAATIKSKDVLEQRIKSETEGLKAAAAAGKLSETEKQKRLADIQTYEQRILDLKKEQTEQGKKQAEDTKKFWDALKGQQKTLSDNAKAVFQKAQEEAKKVVDAMLKKESDAIDVLKQKLLELQGKDGKSETIVQKIRGSLTDEQTVQQIGKNRQAEAERLAKLEGRSAKGIAEAGRRAKTGALEQYRQGGTFDQSEVAKAQDELTASVIDQAAASGQLSDRQAKALRAAADAAQEQAKVQQQQASDIEAIQKTLEGIFDTTKRVGERQRAQRGSSY